MANEQNLIPHQFTSDQSREQAAINGRKGGKASGAARRAKRDAKMIAEMVLDMKPDLPLATLETMRRMGLSGKGRPDMRMLATMAIMQKAMKGDVKAYEFILSLAGETAESEFAQIRTAESRLRHGQDEVESEFVENDIDAVRSKISSMTDEQLEQYEKLCVVFAPEAPEDGAEDG